MKKSLARWLLQLTGWQLVGVRPDCDHYVLIAAPHTSNWDFPLMLIFAAAFEIKVTWMAKHSLFYPPMGWIMRALGGKQGKFPEQFGPVRRKEEDNSGS
jgi:Acyltransferase